MRLSLEHEMVRDAIRQYVQQAILPHSAQWDREHRYPAEIFKALGQLGALAVVVPEEFGGAGMDYRSLVLAIEEIAAGDGALSTVVSVQNSLVCGTLLKCGSKAQQADWLPALARGDALGCFALTKPQAGSDASALLTTAVREGDHWVIHVTKQFITSGKNADLAIVFAVTNKAAGKKGISCFLVPTSTPGYQV